MAAVLLHLLHAVVTAAVVQAVASVTTVPICVAKGTFS